MKSTAPGSTFSASEPTGTCAAAMAATAASGGLMPSGSAGTRIGCSDMSYDTALVMKYISLASLRSAISRASALFCWLDDCTSNMRA